MTSHRQVSPEGAPPLAPEKRPHRLSRGLAIALLIAGWAALFGATEQPLLASIQLGMIGLGAIGTAIVAALWRA